MFAALPDAGDVLPPLQAALAAVTWQERQAGVVEALAALNEVQRGSGLPAGREVCEPFYDRPFASVRESVCTALLAEVTDPLVRVLPAGVGSIEQWVDNIDVLKDPARRRAVAEAWRWLLLCDRR